MKMYKLLFLVCIALSLGLTSCDKDDSMGGDDSGMNDDDQGGNNSGNLEQFFGGNINGDFFGQVVDESNNPIEGAAVKIGTSQTSTDENGIFRLENASIRERFAYARVTAPGYVTSGRSVTPTTGENRMKIMLLTAAVSATVNSGSPETIALPNGATVDLPGEYIDENGNAYNGAVDVILDYLDPADADLDAVMPGMLYAEDEAGDEAYLETFGMISVELRDGLGNELNIDPTNPAELRFPLDPALMGVAPATIPLWSFNDTKGYWIEDGEAVLVGNEYVGEVTHFSFWNCDAPFPVVDFCTTVVDANGNPLSNTTVSISSPNTPYPRTGVTNADGEVCGKVPSGVVMTIEVLDICGNVVESVSAGPFAAATVFGPIVASSGTSTSQQVIGTFNNCSNNPVTNGYVIVTYAGNEFYDTVNSGAFSVNLLSCNASNTFTLEAIDIDNVQTSGEISYTFTPPVTNVGTVTSCNAVTEYIEYSISGGTQQLFVTDITQNQGQNGSSFSVYAQNANDFFYISSSDNTPGSYTWGGGLQDPPGSFTMEMLEVIFPDNGQPITIAFQLNAYGAVGDYIDLTFNGGYTDQNGDPQTISGSMHILRDN